MIDQNSADASPVPLAPPSQDLVNELLTGMRMVGLDYRRIEIAGPFGLRFPGESGRARFHFIGGGSLLLRDGRGAVHPLSAGDAVLMPRDGVHELLSGPGEPVRDIGSFSERQLCRQVTCVRAASDTADALPETVIFSGRMEFDLGGMNPLVDLMPETMLVGTLTDRYPEILPMLDAMEREARGDRAGYAGILARLADVIAAFIVRAWVECGCGDATGWVMALRDPRLGNAIAALHRAPGRDWTVAELAAVAGSSRSVFAERFQEVTGMTPLRYLTELRMRLAVQWIGRENMAIERAAERLGYGSQAAFGRAFKRVTGYSPGLLRGAAR